MKPIHYMGKPLPYEAKALLKIPSHDAKAIIRHEEIKWQEEHNLKKVKTRIATIGFSGQPVRCTSVASGVAHWSVYDECQECEGDGGFYSATGRRVTDCSTCNGAGFDVNPLQRFTTDLDGDHITVVCE